MTKFDLENFKKYLSKNPEKEEGKTWKFRENSGYSEKKFLIEATDYSEFGTVSKTEKLKFNEEDLTESFFDDRDSLIKKVLKEYLKQKDQEEKSPKNATKTLIFSPLVKSDYQPTVDAVDKKINFYCRGLSYEGREIKTIILDAENTRDNVVSLYLAKKCLLEFDVYDEIKKIGETTLLFSNYRLSGFFKGLLEFKVLKIREGYNDTLKIEVGKNLFNSNSKTLLLPKNNKLVKKVILDKKKSREVNDKETGADFLETDWSEIEGKTFTIKNINGEKCYFENDGLVLNEFEDLITNKEYLSSRNRRDRQSISTKPIIPHLFDRRQEYEDFKKADQKLKRELTEYKEELEKTKQLLNQKEQEIWKLKENKEEHEKEKQRLSQELNQANKRVKELEKSLSQSSQRLRELHDFAKNGSSSPRHLPTNSDLKTELTKLQKEQQELQIKLATEKKKNKDLTQQIEKLTNNANSVSLWRKYKKPIIVGGAVVGIILLGFLVYKYYLERFLSSL